MTNTYPVLTEKALTRTKGRMALFAKRDLAELPQQPPGTVLVFELDGRYEVLESRRHLTGREEVVIEAVSVAVVDTRERLIPVDVYIPSASPADDFRVRVTFACLVTNPEAVVRHGLSDVTDTLREHLRRDRQLESLGEENSIDELNEVRGQVLAQVKAYCRLRPLRIDGVQVRLSTVDVFKPTSLVKHTSQLRDDRWAQKEKEQRLRYEQTEAERMHGLLRSGPEALQALAIARGDVTAGQAADQAFVREQEKQQKLLDAIDLLQKSGHLDRLPGLEPALLVEALTESIMPARSDDRPRRALSTPSHEPAHSLRRGTSDDEDLLIDEDELNDDL